MQKTKTIIVFGLTFIFLGMLSIITLFNIQEEYDIAVLAYAEPTYTGQERFIERYIPYSDVEMESLINRINEEEAKDGTLYVITRKTGFPNSLFVPNDYVNIWKPDCMETKKLIQRHKLSFQDYEADGKTFHLIIDEGRISGKSHSLIKYESELSVITDTYDEVLKCGRHSGGGILINPIY